MSIVDKSVVFLTRSQVPKKSGSSKSSSTGHGGGGGGRYELIGAKQKIAKRDDGYILPSKGNKTATHVDHYELPKGKFSQAQPTFHDDHSVQDERPRKKKNSLKWLVAVVLLVTIAMGMTVIFAYSVYTMMSNVEPLPNLSDQCRYHQQPSVHQYCVYHRRKYPDNCSSTMCNTVLLKWNAKAKNFIVDNKIVNPLHSIEDQTPCQDGKWCMKGLCVKTSDSRIKEYSSKQPVEGKWKNNCNEPTCMEVSNRMQHHSKQCIGDTACKDNEIAHDGHHKFQIGFRSCTNPFPSYGGKFCGSQEEDSIYGALYVSKYCGPCDNVTVHYENCNVIPHTCKIENETCSAHTDVFPLGHPCNSNDDVKRTDICYSGLCLENIKPMQDKCD